jgi:hypothetical protein
MGCPRMVEPAVGCGQEDSGRGIHPCRSDLNYPAEPSGLMSGQPRGRPTSSIAGAAPRARSTSCGVLGCTTVISVAGTCTAEPCFVDTDRGIWLRVCARACQQCRVPARRPLRPGMLAVQDGQANCTACPMEGSSVSSQWDMLANWTARLVLRPAGSSYPEHPVPHSLASKVLPPGTQVPFTFSLCGYAKPWSILLA